MAAPVANVNPDAIVAEEAVQAPSAPALSLVGMRVAMKGLSPNADALQNIQQLKGYCVAGRDQALDMLEQHKTAKLSALVNLITEFGADAASKELVVEYGQMMNKIKTEFGSRGLPIYLLDHLDQAVLSGEGIITTTGAKARFNSEELGFEEEPSYIKTLEVSLSVYTSAWTTAASESSGADDQAALECLQAGTVQKYSTFLDQIQAKYKAKAQEYWEKVVKGAESAEADAFDSTSTLKEQAPAGLGGATAAIAAIEGTEGSVQLPSDEEMAAEAEKMARDWASGNLKTRCADVVEDVEELESGEVAECKMIAGSYGAEGDTVVTAEKGEIKASFDDDSGNQMHGSIANETDTTCSGSANGLQTSVDGDSSKAHKFSYDDGTHTITWEDGSTWTKYTPPAPTPDATEAPTPPPTAEQACKAHVLCAAEHGQCSFSGEKTVRYGLNGKYKNMVHSDGVKCSNSVFGDPVPGTRKSCFVEEDVPCDGKWTFCTQEHGTCSFSGTKMVRYGAVKGADEFWYAKEATGSIACSNSVFGDPLPGTKKACYTFESESLSSEAPSTDATPTACEATTKRSSGCKGDDCLTKVSCPAETFIEKCEVTPLASSDGAYIDTDNKCVGVGNGGSTKVYAKATCGCSGTEVSSVVSDSKYLDSQTVKASCPEGSTATSCNCQSAWKVKTCNNEATFSPEGNVCSQAIGPSGGRRRGKGAGAGAKIYAVCATAAASEEEAATPTALTCPEGTEQVGEINADIPGCGLHGCGDRYAIDTIEDCKSACEANGECVAFTWAPIGGDRNHMDQSACTQYDSAVPTSTWAPNQIFCKTAAPTCTPSPPELVSQGKPASMSSDGGYGAQGSSSNAVDGNTNTNWGGKSCTHTKKEQSPWWAVDLQSSYNVDSVKVYNRGDCCGSRLNNFGVKVGTAPNTGSECGAGNYKIGSGKSKTVDCSGAQGSYVTIFKKNRVAIQICEVQVYASAASASTETATAAPWCEAMNNNNGATITGGAYGSLPGRWWTGPRAGYSCDKLCGECGKTFDAESSKHHGNAACMHFHPRANAVNAYESIECGNHDANGQVTVCNAANGNQPSGSFNDGGSCYVFCACK